MINKILEIDFDVNLHILNKLGCKGFELTACCEKAVDRKYFFIHNENMERFEYKIINQMVELSEGKLNALGRRGFELVSVDLSAWGCKYFFKRRLAQGEEPHPVPEKTIETEAPF